MGGQNINYYCGHTQALTAAEQNCRVDFRQNNRTVNDNTHNSLSGPRGSVNNFMHTIAKSMLEPAKTAVEFKLTLNARFSLIITKSALELDAP